MPLAVQNVEHEKKKPVKLAASRLHFPGNRSLTFLCSSFLDFLDFNMNVILEKILTHHPEIDKILYN